MNHIINLKHQEEEQFEEEPREEDFATSPKKKRRRISKERVVFMFVLFLFTSLAWNLTIWKTKWRAVFMQNNQVYFGKFLAIPFYISDVYYLEVLQPLQPPQNGSVSPESQPQVTLIKLGNELHGPTDLIIIPKNQILFWETMKNDSQVVKAILSTKSGKK